MKRISIALVMLLSFLVISNCSSDDSNPPIDIPGAKQYDLYPVNNSGISGTVKIIKNEDLSITYEIQVSGTSDGTDYPVYIQYNSAAESGELARTLTTVNGTTGFSTTTSTELEPGTMVTYEELLNFDGHITIVTMVEGVEHIVAQADIGPNELTTTRRIYPLNAVNASGVEGTLTFIKRLNGQALAVIQLTGTTENTTYPAHIHMGSISEGGSVFITFTPINGTYGSSRTNIDSSDGPEIVGYDDLMTYNGHADVHSGDVDNAILANGTIGL